MIAILTLAIAFQMLCHGRRLNPRSLLAQQVHRQNGSPPLKYSTALTIFIISSEWLLNGRVSPVRSQCQSYVLTMSSKMQRYYRKKEEQAIEGVLESIAPGNVSWLHQQVIRWHTCLQAAEGIDKATLVGRRMILYEEPAYWYMRQQILSLFVTDHSKTELLNLIPGLSKSRIDKARKHAFQTKPGLPTDPPRITRCRLDAGYRLAWGRQRLLLGSVQG